jgi:hypothetical protein
VQFFLHFLAPGSGSLFLIRINKVIECGSKTLQYLYSEIWGRHFYYDNNIYTKILFKQKIITDPDRETVVACAVLHNIAIQWDDEDDEQMDPPPAPQPVAAAVGNEDEEPALVRAPGQAIRDRIRLNIPWNSPLILYVQWEKLNFGYFLTVRISFQLLFKNYDWMECIIFNLTIKREECNLVKRNCVLCTGTGIIFIYFMLKG